MSLIIEMDESRFEQDVAEKNDNALVVFTADWCRPCRTLMPVLEDVARDHDGRLKIYQVDVDDSPTLASRLGARGIPTLFLFVEGALETTRVGAVSRIQLQQMLDEHL